MRSLLSVHQTEGRTALSSSRQYSAVTEATENRSLKTVRRRGRSVCVLAEGGTVADNDGRTRLVPDMDRTDLDRNEADAAEQAQDAYPSDDTVAGEPSLDDEAPEWDAQEQRQAVLQDDDYR